MVALDRFGVVRGSWLTVRRLVRCQPLCDGGADPVPLNWPKRGQHRRCRCATEE
jgi:uncharacterized protein